MSLGRCLLPLGDFAFYNTYAKNSKGEGFFSPKFSLVLLYLIGMLLCRFCRISGQMHLSDSLTSEDPLSYYLHLSVPVLFGHNNLYGDYFLILYSFFFIAWTDGSLRKTIIISWLLQLRIMIARETKLLIHDHTVILFQADCMSDIWWYSFQYAFLYFPFFPPIWHNDWEFTL